MDDDQKRHYQTDSTTADQRQAAVNLIKSQIDTIYQRDPNHVIEPLPQGDDSYKIIYNNPEEQKQHINENQWRQYHSAWQNYYQKYYEGYYAHHYSRLVNENRSASDGRPTGIEAKKEEMANIQQRILDKVSQGASKVRKSHHFIPILSGLIVVLVFLFLQYNQLVIGNVMAYISPGEISPQNIIVDPNLNLEVGPEPRIIVPKINVDAPVSYDIPNDYQSIMDAMRDGLAHFAIPGASSHPGEVGNTVISGHSASDLFSNGNYKFIFAQLERLEKDDIIYANYKSKRYTYKVTGKQVVGPNDVGALIYPTTVPVLTLLTCVPVGTANSRLLVSASQIDPDPTKASSATSTDNDKIDKMPSSQPTLLERLINLFRN